ncbi:MAG: 2Fe-2S iron-sulfur cluster-binding protein [Gemmatimonadota bacterium]
MATRRSGEQMISLSIDGRAVQVLPGATIWEAARLLGIGLPVLCHDPRLEPVGVCRLCLVEVGEPKLTAACVRGAEDGMEVRTSSERLEACRRGLVELLLSDYPVDASDRPKTGSDALVELAAELGVDWPARRWSGETGEAPGSRTEPAGGIPAGDGRALDGTSKVIVVDHQACILCDRCIRGCDDLQVNEVMGRTGKGYQTSIAFDLDVPMGESTCVSCGECEKVCPTGALSLVGWEGPPNDAAGSGDVGWEVL